MSSTIAASQMPKKPSTVVVDSLKTQLEDLLAALHRLYSAIDAGLDRLGSEFDEINTLLVEGFRNVLDGVPPIEPMSDASSHSSDYEDEGEDEEEEAEDGEGGDDDAQDPNKPPEAVEKIIRMVKSMTGGY